MRRTDHIDCERRIQSWNFFLAQIDQNQGRNFNRRQKFQLILKWSVGRVGKPGCRYMLRLFDDMFYINI